MYENELTGTIPSSLGNLISLGKLIVLLSCYSPPSVETMNYENLTHIISIQTVILLDRLLMSKNRITGTIPSAIGNMNELGKE